MTTAVFARGMRGDLVEQLQRGLMNYEVPVEGGEGSEPALKAVDGDFGPGTQRAIRRVQRAASLPITGVVDEALWTRITKTAWPTEFERAVSLLASFEGHGYTKAAGNYDGAGVTWGIIGFTLVNQRNQNGGVSYSYGSLHTLLTEVFQSHEAAALAAFGKVKAKLLREKLAVPAVDLHKFAVSISDTNKHNRTLIADWQQAFARLGNDPGVRELQRSEAKRRYYEPALEKAQKFADEFDMPGERTQQLFFDIQVNNGGLGPNETKTAKERLTALIAANANATLSEKLNVITKVLADSRPKFSKDIWERKGTISDGFGRVHGKDYRLEGWGIELEEAPPALRLHLGVLGVDPLQQQEQLTLADAARTLKVLEGGALLAERGLWPVGRGIDVFGDNSIRTLSLRGLLGPTGTALIRPEGQELLHAVNLMFRHPVGLLAVFGQTTPLTVLGSDQLIIGRGSRCYAGIALTNQDELKLVRQSARGVARDQAALDITEIRPLLRECRMLMLFAGYGIPAGGDLRGSGERWREWLLPVGSSPIVLGWFGNIRVPQDADQRFVSGEFLARLGMLKPGADLQTLCDEHPDAVVQLWGEACYQAFHFSRQKFLWRDQPLPSVDLTRSGAAAIGRDGRVWHANADYIGNSMQPAMKVAA